jgi:hypothetical protein
MKREDHEQPAAMTEYGWRFHHIGIPTNNPRAGERYIREYKMFVSGFEKSPYGIEWMRFENGSAVSDIVKNIPHVAFEVDDLDIALKGKEILAEPVNTTENIRVAMIISDGAPVELIEFKK